MQTQYSEGHLHIIRVLAFAAFVMVDVISLGTSRAQASSQIMHIPLLWKAVEVAVHEEAIKRRE